MQDLLYLELLIVFLLFVSLVRPLIKRFRNIQGILLVPYLSLAILIGLYLAYGFRPELIPLVLFTLFFCVYSLPKLYSLLNRIKIDDYQEISVIAFSFRAVFFLVSVFCALYYFPHNSAEVLESDATFVHTDALSGTKLLVRTYMPQGGSRKEQFPVILLIPPVHGSIQVVDSVCSLLSDTGFFVLTYSRPELDYPGGTEDTEKYPLTPRAFWNMYAFTAGASYKNANAIARSFERERLSDIYSLLRLVKAEAGQTSSPLYHADADSVIGVGYGSGGAALALYASAAPERGFKGFVAIESPIYTLIEPQYPPELAVSVEHSIGKKIMTAVTGFFGSLRFRKEVELRSRGTLKVPGLFFCSDRIQTEKYRKTRYTPMLSLMQESGQFAGILSLAGTGLFDYSELPELYPIYSALFGSLQKNRRTTQEVQKDLAALIKNFHTQLRATDTSSFSVNELVSPVSVMVYTESNK